MALDEGFVKTDSEFAGHAVDAWEGLGFPAGRWRTS